MTLPQVCTSTALALSLSLQVTLGNQPLHCCLKVGVLRASKVMCPVAVHLMNRDG